MDDPISDETTSQENVSYRAAMGVVILATVAVFVFGGAVRNFEPRGLPGPDSDRPLPELLEPSGDLPTPPTTFRWHPSGPDVAESQLLLYRGNLDRLWSSGPLRDSVVTVPLEAYHGVPAGETCFWRVREVAGGRALAASALTQFQFETDSQGYGVGEAPGVFDYIEN